MLEIIGNGSKWAGSQQDPIEVLYDVLAAHPLDSRLAPFVRPDLADSYLDKEAGKREAVPGAFWFTGNFVEISHGFRIRTDDPKVIDRLNRLIEANISSVEYEHYAAMPSIWDESRKRFGGRR